MNVIDRHQIIDMFEYVAIDSFKLSIDKSLHITKVNRKSI
jgi:hypothetical protein